MPKIDDYLLRMKQEGASDLHMMTGAPAKIRVHGELEVLSGEQVIQQEFLLTLLWEIVTPDQKAHFLETHDLDFAYGIEGQARFRCNYLWQKSGPGAVFRLIPEKIKSIP